MGMELRIEGELAKNPSFWTRRVQFVSDYAPVKGVWLHGRTLAHVKVRGFGEYVVVSECGPYEMWLNAATSVPESWKSMLRTTPSELAGGQSRNTTLRSEWFTFKAPL